VSFLRVSITGVAEINAVLTQLTDKHAERIIRNTNYAICGEVRDRVRQKIPVGKTRVLRKSVSIKSIKGRSLAAQLYFKPGGFYWRFLEHGTKNLMSPKKFLQESIDEVSAQLPQIINQSFTKVLQKQIDAELKRQARRTR
jgi:HK97 gp10 family phage protein